MRNVETLFIPSRHESNTSVEYYSVHEYPTFPSRSDTNSEEKKKKKRKKKRKMEKKHESVIHCSPSSPAEDTTTTTVVKSTRIVNLTAITVFPDDFSSDADYSNSSSSSLFDAAHDVIRFTR